VVLGTTGVSGRVALQAAKLLGAGTVVIAGRDGDALKKLQSLGADHIAVLGGDDDAATLRDAAGGGADVVFDPLFGAPLVAAVKALNPGGRSVTIGMSASAVAEIPFAAFLGQSLLSHTNMTTSADLKRAAFSRLVGHVAAGEIVTETEDIPLEGAEEAWSRQQEGPKQKLVIRPPGA